jgi:fermentation-respiration switch protein FrsA (DUF1100 family)
VCHGFGSRKENYAGFGERASAAGFAALILDLRGAAALQYLQTRPEVNPAGIALRGTSLGGWLAIHTAAHLLDLSPVIAISPTTELLMTGLMDEVSMVQRGHPSALVPQPPPRVDVDSTLQLINRLDILKAAKRISPRHLLLIHCEGDEVVPLHNSERIYEEAREPKSMWLISGGDHRFAQHDPEVDARTFEWLEMTT